MDAPSPRFARRLILFGVAALVTMGGFLALLLAGEWPGRGPLLIFDIALMNSACCFVVGTAMSPLRRRAPAVRLRQTFGVLLAGAVVAAPPVAYLLHQRAMGLAFPVAVVGAAMVVVAAFYLLGDAIAFATRRARSVQIRIAAVGLMGALVCTVLPYWLRFEHQGLGMLVLYLAIGTVIVGALSGILAERLVEPLGRTVKAMQQVTRGDLDIQLAEDGRDEIAALARAFNEMILGLRERDFLERAFGRYVAPSVLDALRKSRALELAAQRREASVLFADVRGFTSFSEKNSPEEVLRTLNRYFERVVHVVAAHEGYLNKFIGDAVMVVFNAPLDQPDHAERALRCAKAMQAELAGMNARGEFGAGHRLEIGIGVNSGPLVAGNVGGEERTEYSVIGDTVNTASRLCSKASPGEILVGAGCARAADEQDLEGIAPLTVKGKAEPLEVFRVRAA
jgi:class 3 adenylate cyclase